MLRPVTYDLVLYNSTNLNSIKIYIRARITI